MIRPLSILASPSKTQHPLTTIMNESHPPRKPTDSKCTDAARSPGPAKRERSRPGRSRTLAGLAIVLATAACLIPVRPASAAPSLQSNHDAYYPEEDIVISFSDGPGNAKDWIGIYPPDVEPGPTPSTRWYYVDGTQAGNQAIREGSVTFAGGLTLAGDWAVYFLLNDDYTKLATNLFQIVDPGTALVRASQRRYTTGQAIEITFTNGPANAKDWVGIYKEGQTPGGPASTLWFYVDGTQSGNTGRDSGKITFGSGLAEPGNYVAYLLLNDGYDILARESFVVQAPAAVTPRILTLSPANGAANLPPVLEFVATITNGTTKVVTGTVGLTLDGTPVTPEVTQQGELITVRYTSPNLPAPESAHTWVLTSLDNATPANPLRAETRATVGTYRNIVLPAPLYFENFDALAEGSLPVGWTDQSYSTPVNESIDFGDLGSAAYRGWTAVNADRFNGSFVTYGNPENPPDWGTDYQRVNRVNPFNVLNGQAYREPLAKGRFLFGNSGYQNGAASQVLYLFTRDYDLTGRTNVHVAFKSLWEQNQDSLAAIEYSIDRGASWLPIAYFLDAPDIVTVSNEITGAVTIDAEATFNAEQGDVARYTDEQGNEIGGTYGAFIAAPISAALAPFIQARVNDDPVESKRIELFALPQADNRPAVRFRFAHAGTDSWYFGIDDFGLYSITSTPVEPPSLSVSRSGSDIVITWPASAAGATLQSSPTLAPAQWETVPGVTGNSHRVSPGGAAGYFRLQQ